LRWFSFTSITALFDTRHTFWITTQIRMDSKLLGSNIARYGREGIVHERIRQFYRENEAAVEGKLKAAEVAALKGVAGESGSAVTYRSTKEEVEKKFGEIGKLMYALVKSFKGLGGQRAYDTLKRVFEEQYRVVQAEGEKKTVAAPRDTEKAGAKSMESPYGGELGDAGEQAEIVPRETKEIDAKSVQSPHGPDCHYRNKNGNGVKGYSINVTETCDTGKLNLIVDVQTEAASMADNLSLFRLRLFSSSYRYLAMFRCHPYPASEGQGCFLPPVLSPGAALPFRLGRGPSVPVPPFADQRSDGTMTARRLLIALPASLRFPSLNGTG
jgi:hypothetical protein